jgi:hypothetical protein
MQDAVTGRCTHYCPIDLTLRMQSWMPQQAALRVMVVTAAAARWLGLPQKEQAGRVLLGWASCSEQAPRSVGSTDGRPPPVPPHGPTNMPDGSTAIAGAQHHIAAAGLDLSARVCSLMSYGRSVRQSTSSTKIPRVLCHRVSCRKRTRT